jgi:fused signal recognition particle receptor
MFNFIKNTLKKVYSQITSQLQGLFSRTHIDEEALKELETILINADTGIKTTKTIIANLKAQAVQGALADGKQLHDALQQQLLQLLTARPADLVADIYLLVGINGSGKTTFAGKLANQLTAQGNSVMLVAADTFRAAAVEQLTVWAQRTGTTLVTGNPAQEPASVVFAGCEQFKKTGANKLIIDTAGRLQTKTNLMNELAKIRRIIEKQAPDARVCTLLTVDAMLGQNSFEQAKLFHECIKIDGIVLTKMDGTGKGGIVFSITQELGIPVAYISCGEGIEQLQPFDAQEYVTQLLQSS